MTTKKLFVLLDFSRFSANQLKMADAWAKAYDLELVIVHEQDVVTPALADPTLRTQILFDVQRDIENEFKKFRQAHLSQDTKHSFQVIKQGLIPFLEENADQSSLILMGLKGAGRLMQIFIGSTTIKIIEAANCLVIATPIAFDAPLPSKLVVGVNHRFPINEEAFQNAVTLLGVKLKEIQFVTVLTQDDNREETKKYMKSLEGKFGAKVNSSSLMFEGEDSFAKIKTYAQSQKEAFLVLQKGSRTFKDRIFRRFVINELVYDASIPLLILPTWNG